MAQNGTDESLSILRAISEGRTIGFAADRLHNGQKIESIWSNGTTGPLNLATMGTL